jgi:two-component system sensor histidine kinase RegB
MNIRSIPPLSVLAKAVAGGDQAEGVRPEAHRLRLQTLVRLRWLAVAGQTITVMFVYYGLEFPLPLGPCMAAIAVSAWLNIFLAIRFRANLRLRNRYATMLLAYDIVQLAVLLYLTGGLQNPFSFLFLVPATVSASTLPLTKTIVLGVLTLLVSTTLAFFHLPLPWAQADPLTLPVVYIGGIWTAILCGLGFMGIYVRRISEESKRMSKALTATEMVLAREQQLSALDGLAAAAAHELGTPLATIALVAKELKRELPDAGDHSDDLDLLISQAGRCREILSTLTAFDDEGDHVFGRLKLSVMLSELVEPLAGGGVQISISCAPDQDDDDTMRAEPVVLRNPGILYGLENLIDNAADFARQEVDLTARWTADHVTITIEDDGLGIALDVIDKLGEPYVTTRKGEWAAAPEHDGGHDGMGLGFFIAKTLLERSGASVDVANRKRPQSGAVVTVAWARKDLDVGSTARPAPN